MGLYFDIAGDFVQHTLCIQIDPEFIELTSVLLFLASLPPAGARFHMPRNGRSAESQIVLAEDPSSQGCATAVISRGTKCNNPMTWINGKDRYAARDVNLR